VISSPIWSPSADRIARSNLARFIARYCPGVDYGALWAWSVANPEQFWAAVWEFCGVVAHPRPGKAPWDAVLVGGDRMGPPNQAGPRWFPGARLNFSENLLRFGDTGEALVGWSDEGRRRAFTFAELRREVDAYARALAAAGIRVGDRVAGWLPNMPETVIAMLAATRLGAIWSSCSPDFGDRAILDRFGQIRPRLLLATDRYRYAGKTLDLADRLRKVTDGLPELERVVVIPYGGRRDPGAIRAAAGVGERGVTLDDWLASCPETGPAPEPVALPFDHPLYIMFSSGTTGLPKCIVHGAGGTLLQHLKELVLHTDLTRDDRIFYYTTCGWMMWNWVVSSLAVGATVVLYDGAPLAPDKGILWRLAEAERISVFGTSAKYLALCEKEGLRPGRDYSLPALRTILSTGSPLAVHSYDYVYDQIKRNVHLASISGGTDIISCFALGNPIGPVWRGELQCRGLGMAVDVFDVEGRSVVDRPGELVCTRPFPSMPAAFWDDPEGRRYRAAYFEQFPGVWRHGDWAERTAHDGLIIHGRSDATLNPGGVRIGTAEIYRQVEQLPEVVESLVVAQEWEDDVRVVLFVRLRPGLTLDETLRERICREVREHASPHHVPRKIIQVADLPRTINGKLSELAVRAVLHRRSLGNTDALANPEALDLFRDLAELRT
jgi:acetoacetyl-CoA synthetase